MKNIFILLFIIGISFTILTSPPQHPHNGAVYLADGKMWDPVGDGKKHYVMYVSFGVKGKYIMVPETQMEFKSVSEAEKVFRKYLNGYQD